MHGRRDAERRVARVQGVLTWLAALPPATLYLIMFAAAALENVFPPIPADTVVAFGSFLAARGHGTLIGAFLSTLGGNLSGAALMYGAGRKYGAKRIQRRLLGKEGDTADARLRALHTKYGMLALFVSRFIPGVRALVPPFAGALHLPFARSLIVMGVASGLWYGLTAYLAFRAGANWDVLQQTIVRYGRVAMLVAVGIALIGLVVLFVRRRRDNTS
jgi:membrane protein DedA with SNARE-associated domain